MSLIYSRCGWHVFSRPTRSGGTMYVFVSPGDKESFEVPGRHLNRLLRALKRGWWAGAKRALARIEADQYDAGHAESAMNRVVRRGLAPRAFHEWVSWFGRGRSALFRRVLTRLGSR